MKQPILAVLAVVAILGGGFAPRASQAQPMHDMPAEAGDMSHRHGRHMDGSSGGAFHRRFDDAEKWAKEFDKPERDAWQKPEKVVDALHPGGAASVADVGAGSGYFSVKIAKRIPEGKVFTADVEPDMVRYLGERAVREHVSNLVPVQAEADAANLPEPVDLVLVVDTYHHIGHRIAYFSKLAEIVAASRRPAGDHRLQGGFANWAASRVSYPAREGHRRADRRRIYARGKP